MSSVPKNVDGVWCYEHPNEAAAEIVRLRALKEPEKNDPDLMECPTCGGSGFNTPGTGYGDVCGECGGMKYVRL